MLRGHVRGEVRDMKVGSNETMCTVKDEGWQDGQKHDKDVQKKQKDSMRMFEIPT